MMTSTRARESLQVNIRVAMTNSAKIALEVSDIYRVEPYLRSKRKMINSRTKDGI